MPKESVQSGTPHALAVGEVSCYFHLDNFFTGDSSILQDHGLDAQLIVNIL